MDPPQTDPPLDPLSPSSDPDAPQPQPPQKLRLMCSYGGHIVPRPHDKSLCYVGGDTRIVVVDRSTATLSSLSTRLSSTLLNNRPFTLKYQLPNEDLDSLISVTTDEDLENMLDEYDRTAAKPGSRLRLFLFPLKPESSQSLLDNNLVKNEDWFFSALNGTHNLNRGFSDSAASSVNCLLGLDEPLVVSGTDGNNKEIEGGNGNNNNNSGNKGGVKVQDVQSVPDSPMMETTSSFGSTSSSPSVANLPPIKVPGDDQKTVGLGIEDQFGQISVGAKQDEGFFVISSPPPLPVSIVPLVGGVGVGAGEYRERVYSDDERSDHGGAPLGFGKHQQPPQLPQRLPSSHELKSSGGGVVDLPSPDSVSSDSSFSNAVNRQKPVISQELGVQIPSVVSKVLVNPIDSKMNVSDLNARVQMQQIQDSAYALQAQYDQQLQQQQQPQQFIQAGGHYVHHTPGGAVPISAYYPVGVYPSQQQHQQQQYPVYYVSARQPQAYNLSVQQSGVGETGNPVPSSRGQTAPNANMVQAPLAYDHTRNAPVTKPEMAAAGMYRMTTTGAQHLLQVPSNQHQHQQQYVAYSQVHHPSHSVAPTPAGTVNYGYEFVDPNHAQIYYTQPLGYQTMTGAATTVVLPEASAQLSADNIKQQIRTSQPM